MNQNHDAYALLIVLSMIAIASTLVLNVWFLTSFRLDVVHQREGWYKNLYATEAAFNVGIALAQAHFAKFQQQLDKKKDHIRFDLSPLLKQVDPAHFLLMARLPGDEKLKNVLVLTVQKRHNGAAECQLHCLLKKVTVKTNNGQEERFVVSHFTVGSAV